ncbi:MAG: hypothetical protein ACK50A_02865 [Sphingobacteriaceae bacterium]|jgi:hypothetical protein
MATTLSHTAHSSSANTQLSWYGKLITKLEFSYFGLIAMTITMGSVIGGIAAMFIFQNDAPIWQLGLCMAGAMANNVAAIGQAPTRWVVNIFLVNFVISALLILINAF